MNREELFAIGCAGQLLRLGAVAMALALPAPRVAVGAIGLIELVVLGGLVYAYRR